MKRNNLIRPLTPKHSKPITRQSLAWLLVIQIFIIAPHFVTAPLWIAFVWLLVAFWRWKIFQGAWNYPNKLAKTLLVVISSLGLAFSFVSHVSFEFMISLLVVGFSLKLLELQSQKDFVLLVFIGFFLFATQFIAFNSLFAVIYGFVCLVLLCTLLMQLYKNTLQETLWQNLRPNVFILLQTIPFMFVLFVIVPRVGSFWSIPSPQHAKTGMSDSMSPGDITELMQSDELAFRVNFEGAVPAHEKLYWRSLVFSSFDGRRWTQSVLQQSANNAGKPQSYLQSTVEFSGEKINYSVIAEASRQPFLYVLAAPQTWSGNVMFTRDLRLQAFSLVTERINYQVTSVLQYRLNNMDAQELQDNLQLPARGNELSRRRAQDWMREAASPEKLIEKLLDYYRQSFFYTLQPPALGDNPVDEFLWQSRQGFCEHFASSFVFIMRAAGVPARVVVGYQGGEVNAVRGYLSVRQRDAHAWAEVWLEGKGWIMVDPTGAVAPERIQKGIEQSLTSTDSLLLAKPFGSSFKLFWLVQQRWDAVNYQWIRWVMSYDIDAQSQLMERLLGEVTPSRIAVFILAVGGTNLVVIFMILMWRTKKIELTESEYIYKRFCKKMEARGMEPLLGETPRAFVERSAKSFPELNKRLKQFIQYYEAYSYGESYALNVELQNILKKI